MGGCCSALMGTPDSPQTAVLPASAPSPPPFVGGKSSYTVEKDDKAKEAILKREGTRSKSVRSDSLVKKSSNEEKPRKDAKKMPRLRITHDAKLDHCSLEDEPE
uniref:Uncharacterized protein n=1 Tax=Steinernema glaseri TaxID=37863 RepID=A0A1I8AFP0_9BILA